MKRAVVSEAAEYDATYVVRSPSEGGIREWPHTWCHWQPQEGAVNRLGQSYMYVYERAIKR